MIFVVSGAFDSAVSAADVSIEIGDDPTLRGRRHGRVAIYPRVATVEGVGIDLIGRVERQSRSGKKNGFGMSDGDFRFQLEGGRKGETVSTMVRWSFVEAGTETPVTLRDFSLTIDDLDDNDKQTEMVVTGDAHAYTLEATSNVRAQVQGGMILASGTADQDRGDPDGAIKLHFSDCSSFSIGYQTSFRADTTSWYLHDGNGDIAFVSPEFISLSPQGPSLYYTYTFENEEDEDVEVDFFDKLPVGLFWDSDYRPVLDGLREIDVTYSEDRREASAVKVLMPPGSSSFSLKTLQTSKVGAVDNEATIAPSERYGIEPLTAAAALSLGGASSPDVTPTAPPVVPRGLLRGHIDVDTSKKIAKIGKGKTDGHVHEYDHTSGSSKVDLLNLASSMLKSIDDVIHSSAKFKLIVANADLSPGAWISVNSGTSNAVNVRDYDDTAPSDLKVYSLDGGGDTEALRSLSIHFGEDAILAGGVIPTNTGSVRDNVPGLHNEWRNGALTIQAVAVDKDGVDAFTTETDLSNGGQQGVATSGLLWECTIFWHWDGDSYHQNPDYDPGQPVPEDWLE